MPYTFIVSGGMLSRGNTGPMRTLGSGEGSADDLPTSSSSDRQSARSFVAIAIRKVNDTFPNMITVGRTANDDMVMPDVSVSKFHAFFKKTTRGFELADAGSKNGTWVAGEELAPRGLALAVKLGDRLRFGRVEFTVVDAGVCWDTIDRMRR